MHGKCSTGITYDNSQVQNFAVSICAFAKYSRKLAWSFRTSEPSGCTSKHVDQRNLQNYEGKQLYPSILIYTSGTFQR